MLAFPTSGQISVTELPCRGIFSSHVTSWPIRWPQPTPRRRLCSCSEAPPPLGKKLVGECVAGSILHKDPSFMELPARSRSRRLAAFTSGSWTVISTTPSCLASVRRRLTMGREIPAPRQYRSASDRLNNTGGQRKPAAFAFHDLTSIQVLLCGSVPKKTGAGGHPQHQPYLRFRAPACTGFLFRLFSLPHPSSSLLRSSPGSSSAHPRPDPFSSMV